MTAETTPLDERIDDLFGLPLDEFIGARNALAGELRKQKSVDAAARVKALVKPSASAWVVNQLYRACRGDFDRLLAAGARLRADQQRSLQGGTAPDLPAANRERREAIAGLMRQAELVLAREARPAAPALLKRVETTLEAVAALGGAGPDAALGRLVRDLDPPGFEALFGLASGAPVAAPAGARRPAAPTDREPPAAPASGGPPAARPPGTTPGGAPPAREAPAAVLRRAREQARAAEAAAVEDLERSSLAAAEAEAARAAAAARARQTVAQVAQAKRQLAQAERHAERSEVALERAVARKCSADEDVARDRARLTAARKAAAET